jgi:hypothetical protein
MRTNQAIYGLIFWLLVTSSTVLTGAQAKPKTKASVKPGVLSGRVFLITVAGDIKPARMAKVYVLYMYRSVAYAEAHKDDQDSAGMKWLRAYNKAMEDDLKAHEEKSADPNHHYSEAVWCLGKLAQHAKAIRETLDWVSANNKGWQFIIGQADEEGYFSIPIPHPGRYHLIINGHAGFNDAVWVTDEDITIDPGVETTIKMSSPEVACAQTGD